MKNFNIAIISVLLGVVTAGTLPAATVDSPETWTGDDTAGWVSFDLINERVVSKLSVEDGSARLQFNPQTMKLPPEEYLIKADVQASDGAFVGNYTASGVLGVSFRLYCEYSTDVRLVLYSGLSGRLWRYTVPSVTAGQWQTVNIPVDTNILTEAGGSTDWTDFSEDLRNISWVGVAVTRNNSMNGQIYRLDDFSLVKAGVDFSSWIQQFAETSEGTTQPAGDLDGDGIDNYSEWVAGTSADDAGDFFTLNVDPEEQQGIGTSGFELRWKSQPGRKYSILRSDSIVDGFVEIASELEPTPPENVYEDASATNSPAYFYKLKVMVND